MLGDLQRWRPGLSQPLAGPNDRAAESSHREDQARRPSGMPQALTKYAETLMRSIGHITARHAPMSTLTPRVRHEIHETETSTTERQSKEIRPA
jgi:hypothetical protein